MQIINQATHTQEAINELRRIADMLEKGEAMLYSGSISDSRAYGEMRKIGIDIEVVTDVGAQS